jgi:hypothetical protein
MNFFKVAVGYSFKTHSYLGTTLENYLEKNNTEMFDNVKSILLEPLGEASVWADRVKFQKEYAWTRQLHYIDILECNKNIDQDIVDHYCGYKCIVSALQNFTTILKHQVKTSNNTIPAKELFKFVLHFLQDFNQPMHLMGFFRGGNSYKIIRNKNGRNRTMNLHSFWDSELPAYFIENYGPYLPDKINIEKINDSKEYKEMLIRILNKNMNIICSKKLNSDPNAINYIIFEDYFEANEFRLLFDNYMFLAVNTINYIWSK